MKGLTGPLLKGIAFIAVTGLATTVLALTIANVDNSDTAGYSARFSSVIALAVGDDVRIAGVRVGQVEQIGIVDHRVAQVRFTVDKAYQLPASVTAAIKYRNLVGQRYIALDQGTGQPGAVLAPGGEIPLNRTTPALNLTALLNGFRPLLRALDPKDVNQLANEIVQVLQGEGGTVDSLLAHTASLTATLAQRDQVIGQVVDNLNSVLDKVNSHGDDLGTLVTATQQLVTGLARDHDPIGNAVSGLSALTTSTAGLLQAGRQPLKEDVARLGDLATNLANSSQVVDQFLNRLPSKLDAIGRIASYGSWLNFYLCSATVNAPTPPGGSPPGLPVTASRCK
ncbi:MCE family protein [Kutzneria albida]|uniref:Uncharacterized protein n=1 Tax=Kutzneria albida DSM 43870 TaxID=1449976 RepID=W5WGH1_9PSEU|nr:MCE family protein [Kutzneria albida]AHH99671.1 hypothetical protein KALB_6311 [Kutzneria albida DSM 43870]